MVDWVMKVDPRRSRTIFAYTKFYRNTLRNMATTKDLNNYFAGAPVNGAFFVSVFSASMRNKLKANRVRSRACWTSPTKRAPLMQQW
jgi:hypothetical protein